MWHPLPRQHALPRGSSTRRLPAAVIMALLVVFPAMKTAVGEHPYLYVLTTISQTLLVVAEEEGQREFSMAPGMPLESWNYNGDPCRSFRGVRCDENDNIERIDVSGLGLVGELYEGIGNITTLQELIFTNNSFYGNVPESFAGLAALQVLDASSNALSGALPPFLAAMAGLQLANSLNVAYNFFEAPLPPSLQQKFCYDAFVGNPAVQSLNASDFPPCTTEYVAPPSNSSSGAGDGANVGAIVGGAVGGAVLLLLISVAILAYIFYFGNSEHRFKRLSQEEIDEMEAGFDGTTFSRLRRFQFQELVDMTNNFSEENLLGEGGFALVYKGVIVATGEQFAVKRFKEKRVGKRQMMEFLNEIDLISRAVHRNVLKLEGFCIQRGERIMVNPYMVNGSVRDHLQNRARDIPPLSLQLRRKIAIGAAEGLAYLHDDCETRILHRDVKAANVLLNEKYEAIVADFGLAVEMDDVATHVTTAVRGTFGHIAPEYILTGQTSDKSDVYSFGVFLLEIVTGKDAVQLSQDPDAKNGLKSWFSSSFQDGRLSQMIDIELRLIDIDVLEGEYQTEVLEDMVQVALLCLTEDVSMRPSMAECIRLLQGDGLEKTWTLWQKQDREIGASSQDWDVPAHAHSVTSVSSGLGSGTDLSVVGYNLSGPR